MPPGSFTNTLQSSTNVILILLVKGNKAQSIIKLHAEDVYDGVKVWDIQLSRGNKQHPIITLHGYVCGILLILRDKQTIPLRVV
jgi:hypothetical protein